MNKIITGRTKVIGVIGYPIEHSLSPVMHNASIWKLGLDYIYVPFLVRPEEVKSAVESIRTLNISGINVTVPHKEAVMKYLDEIDETAKQIGAVNTIWNCNGKLIGYNTDGYGFITSLKNDGKFFPKGKKAFLFGAGGAARALSVMLAKEKVKQLVIMDTVQEKWQSLTQNIKKYFSGIDVVGGNVNKDKKMFEHLPGSDIFLNATPIGMHDGDGLPVDKKLLNRNIFIYDVVYNRETELIRYGKKIGAKTLNGANMLVYQGAKSFEIWTGQKPVVNLMRTALLNSLSL